MIPFLQRPAAAPAAREQALLNLLLPIQDAHEQLALITEICAGPGLPESVRENGDLVDGCVSRVWLRRGAGENILTLEWEAESPVVRGLAGLICMIYHQTTAEAAAAHRSGIVTALGLDRQLSPTRLRGLGAVELRIHRLATT